MNPPLRHITWRGSLRSCNYSCHYCPFGKREATAAEIIRDRQTLEDLAQQLQRTGFRGSLLLAPYGEAMIHSAYQEGFAHLSNVPGVAALSCQTNLSFDVDRFLQSMGKHNAVLEKLNLWATFHPSMTTVDTFAAKCRALYGTVGLSVGVVGDPAQIESLRELKRELPSGIRFWINAMDRRGRWYTPKETTFFTHLDPSFSLECSQFPPDNVCDGVFVDGRGYAFGCNRCKHPLESFFSGNMDDALRQCSGKCDCFLAYSNRKDLPHLLAFGPYPQLRLEGVPPKAVFLDLDGTLLDGRHRLSSSVAQDIRHLSRHCCIYLMTARSLSQSFPGRNQIEPYLSGGVFSLGAEVIDRHLVRYQEIPLPSTVENAHRTYAAQSGAPCRQIFRRPATPPPGCRLVREGVFSLVAEGADKLSGVQSICDWNGWDREDILVCGNGVEDLPVLREYPRSVAPPHSTPLVKQAARFHLELHVLLHTLLSLLTS